MNTFHNLLKGALETPTHWCVCDVFMTIITTSACSCDMNPTALHL